MFYSSTNRLITDLKHQIAHFQGILNVILSSCLCQIGFRIHQFNDHDPKLCSSFPGDVSVPSKLWSTFQGVGGVWRMVLTVVSRAGECPAIRSASSYTDCFPRGDQTRNLKSKIRIIVLKFHFKKKLLELRLPKQSFENKTQKTFIFPLTSKIWFSSPGGKWLMRCRSS